MTFHRENKDCPVPQDKMAHLVPWLVCRKSYLACWGIFYPRGRWDIHLIPNLKSFEIQLVLNIFSNVAQNMLIEFLIKFLICYVILFYFDTDTFPFPSTGFIFYISVLLCLFSILLLFSHPFLTFFSLSSLWNWFLTCAVVVQGPPGLPGLKGDPGSKGEKVSVGTYYCACLHGGFISPYMKWADKQTYKQWKEVWAVIFVQVRCANSSSVAHMFDNIATDYKQIFILECKESSAAP